MNNLIYTNIYNKRRNEIEKYLQDVIKEAKNINIPISNCIFGNIKIQFDDDKIAFCKRCEYGWYQIYISYKLLYANEYAIKDTLAHEILHTCNFCMNHAFLWKLYSENMNSIYKYNIKEKKCWDELL